MKFLIILGLCMFVAAAEWKPKSREELRQSRIDCEKSLNLPKELMEKANRLEYPDSDLMKEFVLCGGRTSELWDDTNGWSAVRIMKLLEGEGNLDKDEMMSLIRECLDDNSQGSSLGDWAIRNYRCLVDSKLRDSFKTLMKKLE